MGESLMRAIVTVLATMFFFTVGVTLLFRPKELRDWALRSYYEAAALDKALGPKKLMFTRTYICFLRISGAISIAASGFLVWVYFHAFRGW